MRNGFVKAFAGALMLCGAAGFAMPANAAGVKVGVLTCNVASGWGFIFGSTKEHALHLCAGQGHARAL